MSGVCSVSASHSSRPCSGRERQNLVGAFDRCRHRCRHRAAEPPPGPEAEVHSPEGHSPSPLKKAGTPDPQKQWKHMGVGIEKTPMEAAVTTTARLRAAPSNSTGDLESGRLELWLPQLAPDDRCSLRYLDYMVDILVSLINICVLRP